MSKPQPQPRSRSPPPPAPTPSPFLPPIFQSLSTALQTLFYSLPVRVFHLLTLSLFRSSTPSTPPKSHYTRILALPPRFPITNASSHTLILSSGRKLGYALYGSSEPDARVVFYFHGFPGSRIEGGWYDEIAKKLNVRCIGVDRPGYGWSELLKEGEGEGKGGKLKRIAQDVVELADALGVERFGVMGVSGGGPSALSCAYHIPASRLQVATLICGMGPPDIGMKGADLSHRLGWPNGLNWIPGIFLKWFFRSDVVARVELSDEERLAGMLSEKRFASMNTRDREILSDVDNVRMVMASTRQSYWQGYEGTIRDAKVSCRDFGFKVEHIRDDLPVRLWYGSLDVFVPKVHGETIARRLQGRKEGLIRLEVLEETHISIFFDTREKALRDIVEVMEKVDS